MAEKKQTAASDEVTINTRMDAAIRAQMDAYIADHNEQNEHKATLRSTLEAALKMYLKEKGFWPPPKK